MKKRTSIMIEEDTIKQCKLQDINMSDICQRALESALSGKHFKDEELYLAHLLSRREAYVSRLKVEEEKILAIQKSLGDLNKRIDKQHEIIAVIHKSRVVASLMRQLNEIILSCQFDKEKAWVETETIRAALEKEDHALSKEFFDKHVEWLKTHM